MMDRPLTPVHFLARAAEWFGARSVVHVRSDGSTGRAGWADVAEGACAVRDRMLGLGVEKGDRVAVLAWNTRAHLELYFGVPAAGAVLTMVNVRLAPEQIRDVLLHSGATVIIAEVEFAALVDAALAAGPSARHRLVIELDPGSVGPPPGWAELRPTPASARGARTTGPLSVDSIDENEPAALCYTSGTTGDPRGVLYSHRAIALHTLAIALPDGFGLGERDVILPAVPMFHANAWGLPHAAAMAGAGLVLPGARPSGERLADLLADHAVTFAAGVPTVWLGVLEALRARPRALSPRLRIHSGGAPTPPRLLEAYREEFGIEILTGWGMTELTPVGMVTHPRASMADWAEAALLPVRASQGTPLPFVDVRVVDREGRAAPRDGTTAGELQVRGPWVTDGYYRAEADRDAFADGWLRTGDVATWDQDGYVRLVDRTKDMIRSGGEWIPSVALEHALCEHRDVEESAVVAVPDPRWGERPLACVVPRPGVDLDPLELLDSVRTRLPSWWVPDRVVVLDTLPRTATGKTDKKTLRSRFDGHGAGTGDGAAAPR